MPRGEKQAYQSIRSRIGEAVGVDIRAHLGSEIDLLSGSEDSTGWFPTWARNMGHKMYAMGRQALGRYLQKISDLAGCENLVRPDVYWVAWREDTNKGAVLFAEVKLLTHAPSRNDVFQIIGYCLLARCRYGLLINVDGPICPPWDIVAHTHPQLFEFEYSSNAYGNPVRDIVRIGMLRWSSSTGRFDYSQPQIGPLITINVIAHMLSQDLT